MKTNPMKNVSLDDLDREEVAKALAKARVMIGVLKRGKSMNKDEDEKPLRRNKKIHHLYKQQQ